MPLAPYSSYATLVFVAAVLVLMAFDYPVETWSVTSISLIVPALAVGWRMVHEQVRAAAA